MIRGQREAPPMSNSTSSRDRDILKGIPEAICAFDLAMTITYWSPTAELLYGWSRDEAIGRNLMELLNCDYDEHMSSGLEELLETGTVKRRIYRHSKAGALLIVDGH